MIPTAKAPKLPPTLKNCTEETQTDFREVKITEKSSEQLQTDDYNL